MIILEFASKGINSVIVGAILAIALLILWSAVADFLQSGQPRDSKGRFTKGRLSRILPIIRILILGLIIYYGFKIFFG